MNRYTPQERQQTLDRLLDALRADKRLAGVLIVGSGAVGFTDDYSDIDLAVVVEQAEDVKSAFDDWGTTIADLFGILIFVPTQRAPNVFLYAMLLSGFLELDISFQCLDDLVARRPRWRVAWDRTGCIADRMDTSWKAKVEPDFAAIFRQYMEGTWHYVNHIGLSVARGQLWRAMSDLELIRTRVIELAGLRNGHNTRRFREIDRLSPELLIALGKTLVQNTEPNEILRALRVVVELFINEARELAVVQHIDDPPVPQDILVTLVDMWETEVQQASGKVPEKTKKAASPKA